MARKLVVAICGVAAALGVASARADTVPQGGGANNVVLAQQSTDGSVLARASTQITQVGGPTVTSSNIAVATATGCTTGCDATAVAVQVVFVTGSPQYFAPANVPTAVNSDCTGCGSFAYAWQYVVQTSGPVVLTPAAQQQVAVLRQEISAAAASIVPASIDDDLALQAKLDGLTGQLKTLIDTQTQLAGVQASGAVLEQVDRSS
jgi:hypothetical protein